MGRNKKRKLNRGQSRESKSPQSYPSHPFDPAFVALLRDLKIDESVHAEATYVVAKAIDRSFTLLREGPLVMRLNRESTLAVLAESERIYFTAFAEDFPIALGTMKHGSHEGAWLREHAKVVTDEPMLRSWIEWLRNANGGTLG